MGRAMEGDGESDPVFKRLIIQEGFKVRFNEGKRVWLRRKSQFQAA